MNCRLLLFLFCISSLFLSFITCHGHVDEESLKDNTFTLFLQDKLKGFTKEQQAYIGAFIISSAPFPIFLIILLFRIRSTKILDIMSAFAAGALIGDVFIHNLPEVFAEQHHSHGHSHDHHDHHHHHHSFTENLACQLTKNEVLICWGVLALFIVEKFMQLFSGEKEEHHDHHHENKGDHVHSSNVAISLLGDFIHNVTDGMAIGAGFNKNPKLGYTLSVSIFFHEIPHEVGDFSYLLKQNLGMGSTLFSQLFSAIGAFIGVYLSFWIGEKYSDKIISFASGAFLYLAINTILGDLKQTKSIWNLVFQIISFVLGICLLLEAV